jgi:hypothetical protein
MATLDALLLPLGHSPMEPLKCLWGVEEDERINWWQVGTYFKIRVLRTAIGVSQDHRRQSDPHR